MDLPSQLNGATRVIPDLVATDASLCVPFDVRRLRHARLLWLNEGWFLQSGVDLLDSGLRRAVSQALLEEFAVSSSPDDFRHTHGKVRTLFADRYGGTGGMAHGGSGRCGMSKSFNAKGIGRTPLAPDNVDWEHSHGFLWLDEALRETVAAQIAAAELPHGAVPILAIIDTGLDYCRGNGEPLRRRAIVVRPNFLRPAHFERSIYFGTAGAPRSAQYLDSQRVRHMVGALTAGGGAGRAQRLLHESFIRFARQIGSARAHRLWQGRFLSANISLDGALVDFGSFRAVANWRRAQGLPGESFGEESKMLRAALESLTFYFRKYGVRNAPPADSKPLFAEVDRAIDESFIGASLHALGVEAQVQPRTARNLAELIGNYYHRQQRERVRVDDAFDLRRGWIYDLIRPGEGLRGLRQRESCNESFALAMHLLDAFPSTDSSGVSLPAAQRWLRPRPHLLYDMAARSARLQVRRLTGNPDADTHNIARYLDMQISRSRRHWPVLPSHLDVMAQVCRGHSSALYCRHRESGERRLWIEGIASQEHWHPFGARLSLEGLGDSRRQTGSTVGIELPASGIDARRGGTVNVAGTRIDLPAAHLHYLPAESDT